MSSVVFNGGCMGEKLFDLSKIKLYAIIWGFKIFLRNSSCCRDLKTVLFRVCRQMLKIVDRTHVVLLASASKNAIT